MSSNYRQAYLVSSGLPDCRQSQSSQRIGNRRSSASSPLSSSSPSSRQDQQREVELHQAMAECHLSGLPGLGAAQGEQQRAHGNLRQAEASSGRRNVRQIKLQSPHREPTDSDYLRSSHSDQSQSSRRLHNNLLDQNHSQLGEHQHQRQQVAAAHGCQSTLNGEHCGRYRTRRDSPATTGSLPRHQANSSSSSSSSNNNNNHLQNLQMAATKQQERRHFADFGPVTVTTASGRHRTEQLGDPADHRRAQQPAPGREGPTMSDQDEYARELRRTSQRHHQDHYASQSSSSFNYNLQTNQATCTNQQQQQQSRASATKATNLHVNFNRSSQKNSNGDPSDGRQLKQQDDGQQDDEGEGEGENTRKKKYLTAKYGQQQMNLIKKRLKIEMWLYEQLQELAKRTNSEAELDEIDIDLDQLLDMEDDQTRRRWLQKTLQPFSSTAGPDQPDERMATFIEEILGQSKLL